MARGLACLKCLKFLRPKKNGVAIEEGMPFGSAVSQDEKTGWGPYKLWMADLFECPGCGFQLVAGFSPSGPIAEHYMKEEYERIRDMVGPPIGRVDDCGGAKP